MSEGAATSGEVGAYNQIAARGLERVGALSDGVFAIAMTLIVLEIHLPDPGPIHSDADLWSALLTLAPQVVTYLLSFLTLGIFWSGQQTQLNQLDRADRHLSWIYIAFLAGVAIMPATTSLLAEFISFRLALVLYWANIAILYGAWIYVLRSDLLKTNAPTGIAWVVKRRSSSPSPSMPSEPCCASSGRRGASPSSSWSS